MSNPIQPFAVAADAAAVAAAVPAVAVLAVPLVLLRHYPRRAGSIVPANRYQGTPFSSVERVR